MEKLIKNKLAECHVIFPAYASRGKFELELLLKAFCGHIRKYTRDEQLISRAFDHHIEFGSAFPVVSDIIALIKPEIVYQMNNGPDGYGARYSDDHPYVAAQKRAGLDVSAYAVIVPALEAKRIIAADAFREPLPEIAADPKPDTARNSSGGFRRVGFSLPRTQ